FQFGVVSLSELRPSLRLVAEPTAQFRARGDLLQPPIELQRLLLHPPRPEAFDEVPLAIAPFRRVVDPLQSDHRALPIDSDPRCRPPSLLLRSRRPPTRREACRLGSTAITRRRLAGVRQGGQTIGALGGGER